MRKILFAMMAVLMTLMFVPTMSMPVNAKAPRHAAGLDIYFYETPDKGYAALLAGEVDFVQWSLTYTQYMACVDDPSIQLAGYSEMGIYQIDLNNNYTIADYPGVRNPMNELHFRRAVAHMVDKDWLVNVVAAGFGTKIDACVGAPNAGYVNESVSGENYPYPFDMGLAAAELDAGGFVDTDDPLDGIRNYPAGWFGREDGANLDPIKAKVRNDHNPRLEIGRALCDNLRALGVPVDQVEADSPTLHDIVMVDMNYHFYTGGWILGSRPTYLYSFYNDLFWYPDGSNYCTGKDENGNPNYPDLNVATDGVYYAKTMDDFKAAVKVVTGMTIWDYCVNIGLYSANSFWGYSKDLVGIVNMKGYGLECGPTFLNAKKCDDPATPEDESQEPIRMATINPPHDLNILYSNWYYDYAVLDRVFDAGMMSNPYNLALDNPGVIRDWEQSIWNDPQDGENKTKLIYWIREGVYWHAPITGEEVSEFTAHDMEFTIWYNYVWDMSHHWGGFKDVHHTNIVNEYCIEVYFDAQSIFLYSGPIYPLLPKNEYLDLLCKQVCVTFPIDDPVEPSDKMVFTSDQVVQFINATKDGTPLVQGEDFEIFATGPPDYCHNEIHWLIALSPGETIKICYWTNDLDTEGFYLAGLDFSLTFYSIGPYYPISITGGVGGNAILECNPSHYVGAPPNGEIDWMWTWVEGPKPRDGYYQVTLPDAIYLLKAYGSRGDGVPSENWFPGADLDCYDLCHVGLYDAVMLLTEYGKKFGQP